MFWKGAFLLWHQDCQVRTSRNQPLGALPSHICRASRNFMGQKLQNSALTRRYLVTKSWECRAVTYIGPGANICWAVIKGGFPGNWITERKRGEHPCQPLGWAFLRCRKSGKKVSIQEQSPSQLTIHSHPVSEDLKSRLEPSLTFTLCFRGKAYAATPVRGTRLSHF